MASSNENVIDEAPSGGGGVAVAHADPAAMRKISIASVAGTTIEFYDFFIYGTAAALVFPQVFFPALGAAAGTVASFATLGVAFFFRPLGAVLFGHFGDKLGRKKTLITTLLVMGIATVLVGLMPTAATIGVAAPILLVLMRILQGLAAGGEWAGAALFTSENAPVGKRGFWSMAPSLGGGIALTLGNLTFLVTGLSMSEEQFVSYGWRIPFIGSLLLVALGLFIRLKIEETPVFRSQVKTNGVTRLPFVEALKSQPRELVLAAGMVICVPSFTYIGSSYLMNYGRRELDLQTNFVLAMGCIAGAAITAGIVLAAIWSDRIGRRPVIIVGASLAVAWSLLLFPILDLGGRTAFGIGVFVTMFISGVACGPLGAYMSELFQTRYRYTAAGLSYNLGNMIGGAIPPLIAAAVTAAYGGFVFGVVLAGFCLVSLVCILLLKETRGNDLTV
ncbi:MULTISPECIES: MFS transporter [Nocardiaceae]|uniref:MFS transporter n=1 Tax=Nocardiaceae TaxID=85025 RepID=UPI0009B8245A|nr:MULTISPECIES: MFS transporter [Rhodococcus]